MFTGLIEDVGTVTRLTEERGRRLTINAPQILAGLKVDDSISIDGVCLTIVAVETQGFSVQAVPETLSKTTVGEWRVGSRVNLERALAAGSRLGGHFVLGHVDSVVAVTAVESLPDESLLSVSIPPAFVKYVIVHGSIALDGVSLTVARWQSPLATVSLIPHTLRRTTLGDRRRGDLINLEADVLGKYVESLWAGSRSTLHEDRLRAWGYPVRGTNRNTHEPI